MDRQELTLLLKKLQTELEAGGPVDEHLRQSLQALDRDIRQILDKEGHPSTPQQDDASLEERAQQIEARFASDHPYLANTLRDVMDTLGKMGI